VSARGTGHPGGMSFFERNRKALADRGIDPARLPPGQYATERFPVLHAGDVPQVDLDTWTFTVFGLVDHEVVLSWPELLALPPVEVVADIHCVTKWSKFDTRWKGVRLRDLVDLAGRRPEASHVVVHGEQGYTANLPIADVLGDQALLAYECGGAPLDPEHGFPARTVVPHLYFWKSVKWARGLELAGEDRPGFWERNGYHSVGDPWREQRYWGD
jgi:DMSO/TMAO reductase YedYZ molybdopterin-dependent catalytic subunit